jgi:hypothetical protein
MVLQDGGDDYDLELLHDDGEEFDFEGLQDDGEEGDDIWPEFGMDPGLRFRMEAYYSPKKIIIST